MGEEGTESYAVQSAKWVLLVDGTDEEDLGFAEAVQDELGGKVVEVSESGVEKV